MAINEQGLTGIPSSDQYLALLWEQPNYGTSLTR